MKLVMLVYLENQQIGGRLRRAIRRNDHSYECLTTGKVRDGFALRTTLGYFLLGIADTATQASGIHLLRCEPLCMSKVHTRKPAEWALREAREPCEPVNLKRSNLHAEQGCCASTHGRRGSVLTYPSSSKCKVHKVHKVHTGANRPMAWAIAR